MFHTHIINIIICAYNRKCKKINAIDPIRSDKPSVAVLAEFAPVLEITNVSEHSCSHIVPEKYIMEVGKIPA